MYKISLTEDDINKLAQTFDIAVKSVGLQNTHIIRFTLSILDRCTVAKLEAEAEKKKQQEIIKDCPPMKTEGDVKKQIEEGVKAMKGNKVGVPQELKKK